MSRRSDYQGEMPGMPISDKDVEALLTRREPSDAELRGLSSALARVDLQRLEIRVEERVGVFSLRAAALARESGASSTATVPWWRRIGPKLATSALPVMVVIGIAGIAGIAAASDAAAPGDLLYGIDQALERVGINDGGSAERLEEAATVAANGRAVEALNHAADAVSSQSPQAADALYRAAAALEEGQHVPEGLAGMLQWMSSTDATGSDFGQGVAERARQLGADDESQEGETQNSGPEDPGSSGEPANPAGDENQANQGNQGGNGNPDGNGNPGGKGKGNDPDHQGGRGQGPPGTLPPVPRP